MILCLVALKALRHDFHGGREKGFVQYRILCRVAGFDNRPMVRCNLKTADGAGAGVHAGQGHGGFPACSRAREVVSDCNFGNDCRSVFFRDGCLRPFLLVLIP